MKISFYKKLIGLWLAMAAFSSPVLATDWGLSLGAHDMIVADADPLEAAPNGSDSHTLGVDIGFYGEYLTASNILFAGSYTIYLDHDVDELDPDHIPIWFMFDFAIEGDLYSITPAFNLSWLVDFDFKRNTVSNVEKQFKIFPAINAAYEVERFAFDVKAAAGHYYLEIDDDVAKNRGYGRDEYGNNTYAYSLMADARVKLGKLYTLSVSAQNWANNDEWLENQYKLQLDYDADSWRKDSVFIISVEYTEYNLDPYAITDTSAPGYIPILPWNSDTLVRAYLVFPWDF